MKLKKKIENILNILLIAFCFTSCGSLESINEGLSGINDILDILNNGSSVETGRDGDKSTFSTVKEKENTPTYNCAEAQRRYDLYSDLLEDSYNRMLRYVELIKDIDITESHRADLVKGFNSNLNDYKRRAKEMGKIREEAARHGCEIRISEFERKQIPKIPSYRRRK